MDYKDKTIKNRLSLRQPQADSLEILTKLTETLELVKDANVADALVKVRALYPTCTDFERDFPSVCFSLATGVGKTRLMGAFISYLFAAKGIKNFFVSNNFPFLFFHNFFRGHLRFPNANQFIF